VSVSKKKSKIVTAAQTAVNVKQVTKGKKLSEVKHGDKAQKAPRAKKAAAVQQPAPKTPAAHAAQKKAMAKKALGKSDA